MFGITKIVKGYSIQTYFLYCYAMFISEDITRQRGGVTFGTPCTFNYCIISCYHHSSSISEKRSFSSSQHNHFRAYNCQSTYINHYSIYCHLYLNANAIFFVEKRIDKQHFEKKKMLSLITKLFLSFNKIDFHSGQPFPPWMIEINKYNTLNKQDLISRYSLNKMTSFLPV